MFQYKAVRKIIKFLLPRCLHPIRFHLLRQARLSRKRQALLGQYTSAVLTEGRNGQLLVAVTDTEVGRQLAFEGSYNWSEINFHLRNLNSNSEVLFVGAHVGALLVPIARCVKRVVGIEANPHTFALLEKNIRLNELRNVEIYNFAAGDREGDVEFLLHTQNTGASMIKQGDINERDPIFGYDSPETKRVPMKRLDNCFGFRAFDLVIIDVEGAEFLALKGMTNILALAGRVQVELVPYLIEKAGGEVQQVLDLLLPHFDLGWNLKDALQGGPAKDLRGFAEDLASNTQLVDIYLEKKQSRHAADFKEKTAEITHTD